MTSAFWRVWNLRVGTTHLHHIAVFCEVEGVDGEPVHHAAEPGGNDSA